METYIHFFTSLIYKSVLILPMRNGNGDGLLLFMFLYVVLILPMRNGNLRISRLQDGIHLLVLILPMRNGNCFKYFIFLPPFFSSYPTYEEWKLRYKSYRHIKHCVLILPMRNGNHADFE